MAFAEKDCREGEVLEICTMEQLEKELPRNWIPERKWQKKFSEFLENPFMQKDDDFLKSPAEAPVHRKVLLEDKDISPKTQKAFDKLCEKYDDIISKNSGDIGKTMLVEMEIDTGNHPPIASKPYTFNKLQPKVTKADGGKGCISLIPLPEIDELYAKA